MNGYQCATRRWELPDRARVWAQYAVIYTYEWDDDGDWVNYTDLHPWGALDKPVTDTTPPTARDDGPFRATGYYGWKF